LYLSWKPKVHYHVHRCHWSLSWANKGCSALNASQACNLTTSLYMYMHSIFSFTLLCCLMSTPHIQRCKHSSFYNILFLADSVPCCLTFILTTSCLDNTFYSTPPPLNPTSKLQHKQFNLQWRNFFDLAKHYDIFIWVDHFSPLGRYQVITVPVTLQ